MNLDSCFRRNDAQNLFYHCTKIMAPTNLYVIPVQRSGDRNLFYLVYFEPKTSLNFFIKTTVPYIQNPVTKTKNIK